MRIGNKGQTTQEGALELLDSPGIIPARQVDQNAAVKLAICNDIGEASYDRVVVAGLMCDRLIGLHRTHRGYVDMKRIVARYEGAFTPEMTGEEIVYEVADRFYSGNSISAADKLLGDFRRGFMGLTSLESPEDSPTWLEDDLKANTVSLQLDDEREQQDQEQVLATLKERTAKAAKARNTGFEEENEWEIPDVGGAGAGGGDGMKGEKGQGDLAKEKEKGAFTLDVGKGDYDGW